MPSERELRVQMLNLNLDALRYIEDRIEIGMEAPRTTVDAITNLTLALELQTRVQMATARIAAIVALRGEQP